MSRTAYYILSRMVTSGLIQKGNYCLREKKIISEHFLQDNAEIKKDDLQPRTIVLTNIPIPPAIIKLIIEAFNGGSMDNSDKAARRALAGAIKEYNDQELQALANDLKISISELTRQTKEWETEGFSD